MASGGAGDADAGQEAKDEFDVVMSSFGGNKVSVIKAVRAITGLGLKEAKEMVEGAPSTVKEAASKALGTGFRKGVFWKDLEVVNLPSGKPAIKFHGNSLNHLNSLLIFGL